MTPALRAEFRKLLTVRSTYIISILALVLVGFVSFYVEGFRSMVSNPDWLSATLGGVSSTIGIFVAIVAILLITHEYRHNTIMYTLTIANSRTKVLLAKLIAMSSFAVVFAAVTCGFAILAYCIGVSLAPKEGVELVAPNFYWDDVFRLLYFVVAYTLLALVLGFILRHVVGAIASLFIVPTVEVLLALVLKGNAKYLPFTALEQVHTQAMWSAGKAALLFTVYLVVAWLVAWYLFRRRDAN